MNQQATETSTIDDLAARAVSLGRKVQKEAVRLSVGANATDAAFVARSLGCLADRRPFEPRDTASLDVVRAHIAADLDAETLRTEQVFDAQAFDSDGNQGIVRDVPVRTERGRDLAAFLELYDAFLEAREATLDRIAAHNALVALMQ